MGLIEDFKKAKIESKKQKAAPVEMIPETKNKIEKYSFNQNYGEKKEKKNNDYKIPEKKGKVKPEMETGIPEIVIRIGVIRNKLKGGH